MFHHICHTLGFSLDSGYSITRSRGLTVVAGAPRANHSGAVLLLKKESEGSAKLSMEHILHGPGLASSFGYDVAVVDLNGDRWATSLSALNLIKHVFYLNLITFKISQNVENDMQSVYESISVLGTCFSLIPVYAIASHC